MKNSVCFFSVWSASAPSRTLARRKLVRNRFTIDTDLTFNGNNNSCNDSDPSHLYLPLSQHALLQSQKPHGEDTDRWVEEQFDLHCYEDQGERVDMGQVKETDILSDDDEYCKSVRAPSAEPADLEGKMEELSLQRRDAQSAAQEEEADRLKHVGNSDSVDSFSSCGVSISHCAPPTIKLAPLKQCAVEGAANMDCDVIWVRRDDFAHGCNSDVFWSDDSEGWWSIWKKMEDRLDTSFTYVESEWRKHVKKAFNLNRSSICHYHSYPGPTSPASPLSWQSQSNKTWSEVESLRCSVQTADSSLLLAYTQESGTPVEIYVTVWTRHHCMNTQVNKQVCVYVYCKWI